MDVKRILLATVGYLVITFPVAIVWHLVLFGTQYETLGYIERDEPIFAFGFLSILLQGAVMATMYALLFSGRSNMKRALAFVGLFGLYHWTVHVLADAAKRDLSPLAMWFPLESAYLLVQFLLFGVLLAAVFRARTALGKRFNQRPGRTSDMAYVEREADRVRAIMKRRKGFSERKMFGGIAFMIDGHMCCGVVNDDLVLRLGNDGAADALTSPHVRPMDFTGKPMKSMVYVSPKGYSTDTALREWIEKAAAFARSLPDR